MYCSEWMKKEAYALNRALEVFAPLLRCEVIVNVDQQPRKDDRTVSFLAEYVVMMFHKGCSDWNFSVKAKSKEELFKNMKRGSMFERTADRLYRGCSVCYPLFYRLAFGLIDGFEELYQLYLLEDLPV